MHTTPFAVALLTAVLFATPADARGQQRAGRLKPGDAVPEIDLKSPDGKTAFKDAPGPQGFKVAAIEAALKKPLERQKKK